MVHIEQRIEIAAPIKRCFDLARSIEVHLLGAAHTQEEAVGGVTSGLIGAGQTVRWRAKHLGVRQHLTSRMTAFESPHHFQDTMLAGAFRSMQHDHFFRSVAPDRTEVTDRLVFAAPLPVLGQLAEVLFVRRHMAAFLQKRNAVLKAVAESDDWMRYLPGT